MAVPPAKPPANPAAQGAHHVSAVEMPRADWARLRHLPWGLPLAEWPEAGVTPLAIRRGESRHEVLFLEAAHHRYAIKETSPGAARREIGMLRALRDRGLRALEPVGYVVSTGTPIPVGEMGGRTLYMSGDTGYCVTRLAERVLPQSVLYRYPFTDANKRLLWSAIAELLLDLHEHGVYWGDPSLANILVDLSGHRLTAVLADAETVEVVDGPLSEMRRQQDLDALVESLAWQGEDIRIARGLGDEAQVVTEGDAQYVLRRYAGLRAERERARQQAREARQHLSLLARVRQLERRVQRLNALGYGVLSHGGRTLRATLGPPKELGEEPGPEGLRVATVRPGWYVQRLRELLGARVPRAYAPRLYAHISLHKWLLSERAGRDVGMDAAARDWDANYHRPLLAMLDAYQPEAGDAARYRTYLAILDHLWQMSQREQRAVPVEEAALDYALAHAPAAPVTLETPERDARDIHGLAEG